MLKKVIAVLAALLIVTRIVLMGVSAAMVGAGVMGGIVLILAAALVYSGQYTEAQVDGMSRNEIVWSVKNGIDNGTIDPKMKFPNPDKNTVGDLATISLVDAFTNSEVYNNWKDGVDIIENTMDDWLEKWYRAWNNEYSDVEDIVKPVLKGDVDMRGFGALVKFEIHRDYGIQSYVYYYFAEYALLKFNDIGFVFSGSDVHQVTYPGWGDVVETDISNVSQGYFPYSCYNKIADPISSDGRCVTFYGDVRLEDGTKVDTSDEYEYPLGETEDGTRVTVDMLNPDATVTVDGVTEKPSDYINIEYYTDPAVIDLLQQILNALDKANVVAPDNTQDIVNDIAGDIELDISSSLTDYTVPKAISTVFPFCLPFDFVRGMKLMYEKPKVPEFKFELDFGYICGFEIGKKEIVISFEDWEPLAVICRWFFLLMFSYTLIFLTVKIVKGAGA